MYKDNLWIIYLLGNAQASGTYNHWERTPNLPVTVLHLGSYPDRCMHWIETLHQVILPNIKRTAGEIKTGKVRQYKACMALVAKDQSDTTLVVDDEVLFWFKHRFYLANQFAAGYAAIRAADRFEVLLDASVTFRYS